MEGLVEANLIESLELLLILSAIPLLVSLVVGLGIGIIQAATQLQEQTLSFVPKLLAVTLVLYLLGPLGMSILVDFTRSILDQLAMGS